MGGSVVAQFLYGAYITNLAQAVTQYAGQVLGVVAGFVNAAIGLYTLIIGKQLMFGELRGGVAVTRLVRALVVTSLMGAANYTAFVATPITETIPNAVNDMIQGQQGLTGAQAWDALLNKVDNFSAQIHSQAVGIAYIADRMVAWIFSGLAYIVIGCCFLIWCLAIAAVDVLVPVGAVVIPFYLFDATRGFAERWFGKVVSLFLVMITTLMLGQIVVYQDAQFLQRYSNNIAAAPAEQGYNMAPDPDGIANGLLPTTPGEVAGTTINVDSALNTLGHAVMVFLFGLFLMAISTGIALFIGGSHGFSAAPVFNVITRTTQTVVAAATGGRVR